MTSSNVFSHDRSGLDQFLFSNINEPSGEFLTVASVFGRRGLDPWAEAMRLAALPVATAVENLASVIKAVPLRPTSAQDANALATHLVALLPVAGGSPSARQASSAVYLPEPLTLLILGLAIATVLTIF